MGIVYDIEPTPVVEFNTIRLNDYVRCFDVVGQVSDVSYDYSGMMWIDVTHEDGTYSLCSDEVDSITAYMPHTDHLEKAITELITI